MELWREIIREAGAIQDEFECPTLGDWMTPNTLYLVRWDKGFQTRLFLALVSRSWHSVALQYLCSSLVVRRWKSLPCIVARLTAANLSRWVLRVAVSAYRDPEDLPLQYTLKRLPNLRFLQFFNWPYIEDFLFVPRHLTALGDVALSPVTAKALSELPNLQYLRCSVNEYFKLDRPVIFPQLHTLHIKYFPKHSVTKFFIMPNLRTLRVNNSSPALHDALEAHMPTIHSFAYDDECGSPRAARRRTGALLAPHLHELLIPETIWTIADLPPFILSARLETIHLELECRVLRGVVPQLRPEQWEEDIIMALSSILCVTRDRSATPWLRTVYTNLTSNALTIAGPLIRGYLEEWLENLEARSVQVFTRVYETVLSDAKHVPLSRVLNAPPNFALWPPGDFEYRRWERLADATGRQNMEWKPKEYGIECEWIGPES